MTCVPNLPQFLCQHLVGRTPPTHLGPWAVTAQFASEVKTQSLCFRSRVWVHPRAACSMVFPVTVLEQ